MIKTIIVATLPALLAGCSLGALFHRGDTMTTTNAANPVQTTSSSPASHNLNRPEYEKRIPRLSERAGAGSHDAGRDSKDVWDRVRLGLKLERSDRPEIRKEIEWFADNQEFLERANERARPYLHHIVEELDKRQMPMDLALLPVVESAFQPLAYSRGKAAGIWQFIPATGARFGLKRNKWYDGRRDVIASTRAALDYLQQLHDQFDGDWLNAIAAYNCGEKNVQRAIEQNLKAGRPTDFWSLDLPQETKGYVPRLLALGTVVTSPLRFQITLNPIPNQPYLATVDVDRQIDLSKAATLAGVTQEEMRLLNPGFLRRLTDPSGPHQIVVPVNQTEVFKQALAERAAELSVAGASHRVRKGETLAAIASRYDVAVEEIRSANRINDRKLKPGQEIIIPTTGGSTTGVSGFADAAAGEDDQGGDENKLVHRVQAGDNLWNIARNYRVSVRNLARWNRLRPGDVLNLSQELVIWKNRGAAGALKTAAVMSVSETSIRLVKYEIQDGDSLWTIARLFKVSVDQLRLWNRMPKHVVLQPGDNLDVYVGLADQRHEDGVRI